MLHPDCTVEIRFRMLFRKPNAKWIDGVFGAYLVDKIERFSGAVPVVLDDPAFHNRTTVGEYYVRDGCVDNELPFWWRRFARVPYHPADDVKVCVLCRADS
jgi:hypothetical protein